MTEIKALEEEAQSRWWYLELMSQFPDLEIYTGGWRGDQELSTIELGDRVMLEETLWLPTWFYSEAHDRHFSAVTRMMAMVCDRIRRDRRGDEAEMVLHALAGTDPDAVDWEEIPEGWRPDLDAWEAGKFREP